MLRQAEVAQADLVRQSFFYSSFFWGGLVRYSILINKCLTCPFEVRRKCPGNNDKRKQRRQSVSLLPSLPFDVPSRAPELSRRIRNSAVARPLLSDSPFFYLPSLFLDPPGTLSSGPSLEWVSPLPVIFTGVALALLGSRVYLILVPPLWKVQSRLGTFRDFQGFFFLFVPF